MKGALLELAAKGNEDSNLIGNPQISFFKKVHKKYTNFTKFEVSHHFNGKLKFGEKVSCIIDKKGDLLTNMMLQIKLPDIPETLTRTTYIDAIGNFMIDEVRLKMGGVVIDKLKGDYLDIFYKNYHNFSQLSAYNKLVGKSPSNFTKSSNTENIELIIPLPFWFTKFLNQSLPLICLQYTEIEIEVLFKKAEDCYCTFDAGDNLITPTPPTTPITFEECTLYCDYIYLDSPERRLWLKQEEIHYLIEQTQENVFNISNNQLVGNHELIFNHPVKEIIIYYRSKSNEDVNRWNLYTIGATANKAVKQIGLKFNGLDRIEPRMAKYFEYYQPIKHHPSAFGESIYYYSFCDYIYNYQPSGSCNFSKLDDVTLNLTYDDTNITEGKVHVLACNYNFLKIKSGMAGILFS